MDRPFTSVGQRQEGDAVSFSPGVLRVTQCVRTRRRDQEETLLQSRKSQMSTRERKLSMR